MFKSNLFSTAEEAREFNGRMRNLLCAGQAEKAADEVQGMLDLIDGGTHPIAFRSREAANNGPTIVGWHHLRRLDASISAISFDLSWPGHYNFAPAPDAGRDPVIETSFYTDGAGGVAFSTCNRETLAALCQSFTPAWQGEFDDVASGYGITGLSQLNGAVWNLTRPGREKEQPLSPSDRDAGQLGQVSIAICVYQAVNRAVRLYGLPRPLAVLLGSNEAEPLFHAPIFTREEYEAVAQHRVFEEAPHEPSDFTEQRASSGERITRKRAQAQPEDYMRAAALLGGLAFLGAVKAIEIGQRKLARAFSEEMKNRFGKGPQ
jgi:hypothetical protein